MSLGLPSNRIARQYPRISSHPRLGQAQPALLRGQISDAALIRQFIAAGRATFTVESVATGSRFTYQVNKPKEGSVLFVKVLTGPENSTDYTYIGLIRAGVFSHGKKSSIAADAPSVRAFDWFHRAAHQAQFPAAIRFWHEGKCANCRKKLTVPASVATGFGPDCAEKLGIEWAVPVCEAA